MIIKKIEKRFYKEFFDLVVQENKDFWDFCSFGIDYSNFLEKIDYMKSLGYQILLGLDEKENIIGYVGVWKNYRFWCGSYLELDNFFIKKEYRSKGLGQQFVDYIKSYAKKHKIRRITLVVYVENKRAHKFYENQGFELTGKFFTIKGF